MQKRSGCECWSRWLYYVGATLLATFYAVWTVTAANMQAFPVWVVVLYVVALFASELGAVALGIVIADRLRAAGVARLARRRQGLIAFPHDKHRRQT